MTIPPELLRVVARLGELSEEVVFVGGMVRGILVTDPAVEGTRPTRDVDLIIDVPSYVALGALNESLRKLGFRESMEDDAPICRWTIESIPVDVMPIDPALLGFSNVWYRDGFDHSTRVDGAAARFRIIDAAHFCATKLESFASRGAGDFYHHDLEDIIVLVDGRPSLVSEVRDGSSELRSFLAEEISRLLANERFMDALPGHLGPDIANQQRLSLVIERLRELAALGTIEAVPALAEPAGVPEAVPPSRMLLSRADVARLRGGVLPDRLTGGWQPARSTLIRAARYDGASSTLTVQFKSTHVYEYYNVPATLWSGWQGATSAGRYFHQWIRNRYQYRRVG